jgi:TolB protein
MGGRLIAGWSLFATAAVFALGLPAAAHAAFPGQNGRIAFTDGGNIWVMNADGSNAVNITNDEELVGSDSPQWSPDGTRIATTFLSVDNFLSSHIETMNADGTGRVALRRSALADQSPDWSPDGTRLVFSYYSEFGPEGIRTRNVNGTDVQPAGAGWNPTWSPNGTRIAFNRPPGPAPCPGCWGIYTANPDGTDVTEVYAAPGILVNPDWSPDGRKLVFSNGREIYTINVDGTGLARLTNNSVQDVNPGWSPDGTKILYASAEPPGGIRVMNVDGSSSTFIGHGHEPDWQPIPGPHRADYKNGSAFCTAERDFLGEQQFRARYGKNGNGANAFGKCVSGR